MNIKEAKEEVMKQSKSIWRKTSTVSTEYL